MQSMWLSLVKPSGLAKSETAFQRGPPAPNVPRLCAVQHAFSRGGQTSQRRLYLTCDARLHSSRLEECRNKLGLVTAGEEFAKQIGLQEVKEGQQHSGETSNSTVAGHHPSILGKLI